MIPAMTTRRRARLETALGPGTSARLVSFSASFLRAEFQVAGVNGVQTLRFEGTQWISGPTSWVNPNLEVRYLGQEHRVEVFDVVASFLIRARVVYVLNAVGEPISEEDDPELVG